MADAALLSLAAELGAAMQRRGWTLALAESCTGGGAAAAVTEIAGSSRWFDRGFVTYSNAAKIEMLDVAQAILDAHGAVSEATVEAMARGALLHSDADIAAAISGIAGPDGGTPEKPVGTVCFAWTLKSGGVSSVTRHFPGNRAEVRQLSVMTALQGLLALTLDADS